MYINLSNIICLELFGGAGGMRGFGVGGLVMDMSYTFQIFYFGDIWYIDMT